MAHIFLIVAILFVLPQSAHAEVTCPDWLMNRSPNIPTCPDGKLVPETYPIGAIVISDRGFKGKVDSNFTVDVVKKTLLGAGENTPLIVLSTSDNTAARVIAEIEQMPIGKEQKEKFKKAILPVPESKGYTWQQDYMQPFVDPKTGNVLVSEVQNYNKHGDSYKKVMDTLGACGFKQGPPLDTSAKNYANGMGEET